MIEFAVLDVTPYPEFNYFFTLVIVWFPVIFLARQLVKLFSRS